ncbi:hypothetical protein FB45DRAFT_391942 [Roridomyces roridus]|uniref:Uncharacterized protein n=1 Tax=Roridomyces roridus TaxID=1738132 RepID=A0AAD7B210_9AGAR|nr:hypothetical protein FB45DRAFT_391942 [Roridomyces roridus]
MLRPTQSRFDLRARLRIDTHGQYSTPPAQALRDRRPPARRERGRLPTLALDTLLLSMNQMANFAQCSGCPFISPLIQLGIEIVKNIQQMRDNVGAFAQLANDTYGMLKTIADVARDRRGMSTELERGVWAFTCVLNKVLGFVREIQSSGVLHRFFQAAEDARKIGGWSREIQTAKDSFELDMQMRTHENIVQLLNERRISNSNAQPPAYGESTDPVVPDEINHIVETEFMRLLDIFGVVRVLQEDDNLPVSLRIAHVLNLDSEEDVADVWNPIAQYLGTVGDSERRKRVLKYLERVVCFKARIPCIDEGKYHGIVARWCLGRQACAGDVFYSSDHRVHHICRSTPSPELCEALSSSDVPFDPEDELPEIVSWMLKKLESPGEAWQGLLRRYGVQHYEVQVLQTPDGWDWTKVDKFGFEL